VTCRCLKCRAEVRIPSRPSIEIEQRGIKGPSKSRLLTARSEPLPLTAGNESPHPLLCLVAGSCLTTRQIKRVSSGTYRLENAPRLETIR
jgi:hypothetical protein